MTDPRRQRFAPYVRHVADLMRLRDWEIVVHDETPSNPSNIGEFDTIFGRRYGRISLADAFLGETPEAQREIIVHELLHAHLDYVWQTAIDFLSEDAKRVWRRETELAMDGLGKIIAPHMPLPSAGSESVPGPDVGAGQVVPPAPQAPTEDEIEVSYRVALITRELGAALVGYRLKPGSLSTLVAEWHGDVEAYSTPNHGGYLIRCVLTGESVPSMVAGRLAGKWSGHVAPAGSVGPFTL